MRLLVIGAAGQIGQTLVRDALAAGHDVTAFSRSTGGDVLDAGGVREAVNGHDAVLVAIGRPKGAGTDFYGRAATNVIAAMQACGVTRYVGLSASAMHADQNDGWLLRNVLKPIISFVFRDEYASLREMERILRQSSLEWTLVVPSRLLDAPKRGTYRATPDLNVRNGALAIARADVADAMLHAVEDQRTFRRLLFVAY